MAQILQHRRGTTAEISSQTGAVGEILVDTTKNTVVVMDGSTIGGTPLAKESDIPTKASDLVNDRDYLTTGYYNQIKFSGSYNDLTDLPTLFDGTWGSLQNKPINVSTFINDANYATVSQLFSGSYTDLTNKPTIPTDIGDLTDTGGALFDGNYSSLTGTPNLNLYQLTADAFSGNYADLVNKPSIPTDNSQLGNGAGYITTEGVAVTTVAASGAGSLSYNNTNGVFTFAPADLSTYLTALEFDTAPLLTADLVVNGQKIKTTVGDVTLESAGSIILSTAYGQVTLDAADGVLKSQQGFDATGNAVDNISSLISEANQQLYIMSKDTGGTITNSVYSSVSNIGAYASHYGTHDFSQGNRLLVRSKTPASSIGATGDMQHEVAMDANYIYYCTANYDGVTNIWKRVAWSTDTW